MTTVLTSDWLAQVRAAGLHRRQVRGRGDGGSGRGQEWRAWAAAGGRGGGAEAGGGAAGVEGGGGEGDGCESAAGHHDHRRHRLLGDVSRFFELEETKFKTVESNTRSTKEYMKLHIIDI